MIRNEARRFVSLIRSSGIKVLAGQMASLAFSNIVSVAASFFTVIVLARALTVEEFGRLVLAQAAVSSIFAFLDPRVEDTVVRFVPVVEKERGNRAAARFFAKLLIFDEVVGLAFALPIVVALAWLALPSGLDSGFVAILTAQAGLQACLGTAQAGFMVTDGLTTLAYLRSCAAVITSIGGILGVLVADAEGYLVATAISSSLVTAAFATIALRRLGLRLLDIRRDSKSEPLPLGVIPFTIKASLASSAGIGSENLPLVVAGLLGGPPLAGHLRVALAPGRLAATLFSAVSTVLYPILSRDALAGDVVTIRRKLTSWSLLALPAVAVGSIVGYLVLPALMPFMYGQQYATVALGATVLLAAALVKGAIAWAKVLPLAVGRAGLRLLAVTFEAMLLVGTTAVLAPAGLGPVAVGHFVTATIMAVLWVITVNRMNIEGGIAQFVAPATNENL